jgi:hypothetical protein
MGKSAESAVHGLSKTHPGQSVRCLGDALDPLSESVAPEALRYRWVDAGVSALVESSRSNPECVLNEVPV